MKKIIMIILSSMILMNVFGMSKNIVTEKEIQFTDKEQKLESGLSAIEYDGDDLFEAFLYSGGASSDKEVVSFIKRKLLSRAPDFNFNKINFGCSTLSVQNEKGERLFGRNFDWNKCNAMIVKSVPNVGYESISTVNMDFISMSGLAFSLLSDKTKAFIALYAPLDGMNEKGLVVSVNMISDSASIQQNTVKPDITTTTAVRLLLNKAATVDDAVALLNQYDMHSSMDLMIHFAIADRNGKSIVVEYIDNKMSVIATPIVTNFYLTQGKKYGIGTEQSHTRFKMLDKLISQKTFFLIDDVQDALSSVSKKHFTGFESTEWSIIFNQTSGTVRYFHREDFTKQFVFILKRHTLS